MDSYHTTITIAQELAKWMIGVTATIKKNSKNPPGSLKKNKKMKKGEFVCIKFGNILGFVWKVKIMFEWLVTLMVSQR